MRFNSGKLPHHLISPFALDELAKVLEAGRKKYASRNWEKGLSWDECTGSLMRHLNKWRAGEDLDPETGLSHMSHVLCNAMFLSHFTAVKAGTDDRPKYNTNNNKEVTIAGDYERTFAELRERWIEEERKTRVYKGFQNALEQRRVLDVQKDVREEGDGG